MDKDFKDIVLYEIREIRSDLKRLETKSIVLGTKFKIVVAGVSCFFGTLGSILYAIVTK